MHAGGDVKGVFERLARGIKAVVEASRDNNFMLLNKYGFSHFCPTNALVTSSNIFI